MPPWNADPRHGEFANDRRWPQNDRKVLLAWVQQGCPKGDDKDLPAAKEFPKDWALGKPDLVLKMNETFTIPAQCLRKGSSTSISCCPRTSPTMSGYRQSKPGPEPRGSASHDRLHRRQA